MKEGAERKKTGKKKGRAKEACLEDAGFEREVDALRTRAAAECFYEGAEHPEELLAVFCGSLSPYTAHLVADGFAEQLATLEGSHTPETVCEVALCGSLAPDGAPLHRKESWDDLQAEFEREAGGAAPSLFPACISDVVEGEAEDVETESPCGESLSPDVACCAPYTGDSGKPVDPNILALLEEPLWKM